MPSRDTKLTLENIKAAFNKSLKNAIELGQMPSKASGLPPSTYDAIATVARKYPQTDEEAIQLAHREFSAYLTWRREMAARRN